MLSDGLPMATANDGITREEIVRASIRKAGEQYGVSEWTRIVSIGDGLWDVRFVSKSGEVLKLIQDETFSLTSGDRDDWIALNGSCSKTLTAGDALWRCFDGDTTTFWRSSSVTGEAFIELAAPFGVKEGILSITTAEKNQPRKCTVYADGDKVQEFDLEPKAARQMIQLDSSVQGAKKVRLVLNSSHSEDGIVSIAELALQ